MGVAVVCMSDAAEALLSSSVPDLKKEEKKISLLITDSDIMAATITTAIFPIIPQSQS